MRRNLIWASLTALSLLMVTNVKADLVQFDFRTTQGNGGVVDANGDGPTADTGGGAFDTSAAGDVLTLDGLTITIVDIFSPEYIAGPDGGPAFVESGTILRGTNGDSVLTNISNQDALGIANPSISNGNFDLIGGGTESSDINPGEGFTFTFDRDVTFTEIELESVVATDTFTVSVDGIDLLSTTGDDSFIDDLGTLGTTDIAAGSEITFLAGGDVSNGSFRIETFTVHAKEVETPAVPEPSSLALLGLFGSVAMIRRRR